MLETGAMTIGRIIYTFLPSSLHLIIYYTLLYIAPDSSETRDNRQERRREEEVEIKGNSYV